MVCGKIMRRFGFQARALLLVLAGGLLPACATVQSPEPYEPGSVRNPIQLNGFQGQLDYLRALHAGPEAVEFRFEKTVPGYDNHWLDVYLISPPHPGSELEVILEERPDAFRIYLDGYHPEADLENAPVPAGYRLIPFPQATNRFCETDD